MGASTDNRKRYSDFSPLTPPLKKLKRSGSPSISQITAPPPPAPLRRSVHGPQRSLKVFGLGSANFNRKRLDPILDELEDGFDEVLGLDEYRRMVVGVEEKVRSPAVELPAPVREEVSLPETEEEIVRVEKKDVPLYKELYESYLKKRNDPDVNNLEFQLRLTEQKFLGFRLVDEVIEKKKPEEDLQKPFALLTNDDEDDVLRAMKGISCEVLVTHKTSSIEITRELLQCLRGGAWLNDDVINLYLELLKEREKREPRNFLKCHFFNTFFYKRLISGGKAYDFKAVKRWTTQRKIGYGLIECDKIFVPIHKSKHWCLAIINIKEQKFQYLDSLGGMDKPVLRVLVKYLMDEAKDKSDEQIDAVSWKQETIKNLPLQENGYDCGMFMLKYIDFYSRGLDLTFGQEHMPYFRKRTAKEILRLRAE